MKRSTESPSDIRCYQRENNIGSRTKDVANARRALPWLARSRLWAGDSIALLRNVARCLRGRGHQGRTAGGGLVALPGNNLRKSYRAVCRLQQRQAQSMPRSETRRGNRDRETVSQ